MPDDLETYGDLGLRIPFAVQLQAYNQSHRQAQMATDHNVPGPFKDVLERRRCALKEVHSLLAVEGVLHDANGVCSHPECTTNVIDISIIDTIESPEQQIQQWCSHDVSPEKAKELAGIISRGFAESPTQPERPCANSMSQLMEVDGNSHQDPRTDSQDILSAGVVTDPGLSAARARAQGLSALSRAEAPALDDCPSHGTSAEGRYLQRHKYHLSEDRAQRFATITGSWPECGVMPPPQLTSPPTIEQSFDVSTGAIMEFLGGEVGASLPFSNDAATSTIPLSAPDLPQQSRAGGLDWLFPDTTSALTEQQIDEIIRTTTAADVVALDAMATAMDTTWMSGEVGPATAAESDGAFDVNMNTALDDMTFDDVFETPMDDIFSLGTDHR